MVYTQVVKKKDISIDLLKIYGAIDKWVKKNKGNVCFHGSFVSFDKNNNCLDSGIIAYGPKKILVFDLSEMKKDISKESEEFINW